MHFCLPEPRINQPCHLVPVRGFFILFQVRYSDKSPCASCRHDEEHPEGCPAFPEGIPEEILTGEDQHTKPHPDQVGDYLNTPPRYPQRIQELYDKHFDSFRYMDEVRMTKREERELYAYFRKRSPIRRTDAQWSETLIVSHPEYGKEDKYGCIRII